MMAIGTGVSVASSVSAQKSSNAISAANFAAQAVRDRQNGTMQALQFMQKADAERQQAALLGVQSKAMIDANEAKTNEATENIRRRRAAYYAAQARTAAGAATSGVDPMTGSTLDMMVGEAEAQVDDEMAARDDDQTRRGAALLDAANVAAGAQNANIEAGFLTLSAMQAKSDAAQETAQARVNMLTKRTAGRYASTQAVAGGISSLTTSAYNFGAFKTN
jgi:hypothetical protein